MNKTKLIIKGYIEDYKQRKEEGNLYERDMAITKALINEYVRYVAKPSFKHIITRYKQKYILSESQIEDNITQNEQKGIADVYDYIQNYDFDKERFNVFITSLKIHHILFSHFGDGNNGGDLRETEALLKFVDIDIVPPEEAKRIFNSYIPKWDYIFEKYNNNDIIGYINDCIKLNVELIKLQPFADGNKRTFRSLINLLFKKINIPPIYIEPQEQDEYKKVLIQAMKAKDENDFKSIYQFYYYKICDAIVQLDINASILYEEYSEEKGKTK